MNAESRTINHVNSLIRRLRKHQLLETNLKRNTNVRSSPWLRRLCIASAASLAIGSAHAIDTDPGDWTAPPPGVNLFLLYAQHASRDSLYTGGVRTPDAKLKSDVLIFRYVRPFEVDGLVVAPQFLLPWASLRTGGVVGGLGEASAFGDLILASPVWFVRGNETSRNSFSIAPYLILPTGSYDKGRALNIGENRWKADLQFGGTYQLTKSLDAEGAADVMIFGKNGDAGGGSSTLKQNALYQFQGSLNWHQSAGTVLAVGLSHSTGGRQELDGVSQDNASKTTKISFTASTFVAPTIQLMGSLGRDLKVENGFKETARLNLRLLKVF